ncbi:MAG: hypothetical protein M3Y12_11700 [Bacteroidota bacterium]|nr:hypothetical protein [Bacteroidota bacterium]
MKTRLSWFPLLLLCGACSSDPSDKKTDAAAGGPIARAAPVAPATVPIDLKNGFRTYHFGDQFAAFTDLKFDFDIASLGLAYYSKKPGKENLKIGEVKLKELTYCFYKKKLYSVNFSTTDPGGADKLLASLTDLYGKPTKKAAPEGAVYEWHGQQAAASFKKAAGLFGGESGTAEIKSLTLDQEREQDRVAKNEADALRTQQAGKKGRADL